MCQLFPDIKNSRNAFANLLVFNSILNDNVVIVQVSGGTKRITNNVPAFWMIFINLLCLRNENKSRFILLFPQFTLPLPT